MWPEKIEKILVIHTGSFMANWFFFELAPRDKNMKVRFFWKVVLKFWDLRNFGM